MDSIKFTRKSLHLITPGSHAKRFNTRDSIYEKQQTAENLTEKTINQHKEAYEFKNLSTPPNNPSETFNLLSKVSSTKSAEKALVVFFSNLGSIANLSMIELVKDVIIRYPQMNLDQIAVNIDSDSGTALFGLVLQKMDLEKKLSERILSKYKYTLPSILSTTPVSIVSSLDKIYKGDNLRIVSQELIKDYLKKDLKDFVLLDIVLKDSELQSLKSSLPQLEAGDITLFGFNGVSFVFGKKNSFPSASNLNLEFKYHQLALLSNFDVLDLKIKFIKKLDLRLLNNFLNLYLLHYIETTQTYLDNEELLDIILGEISSISLRLNSEAEVQEVVKALDHMPILGVKAQDLEVSIWAKSSHIQSLLKKP